MKATYITVFINLAKELQEPVTRDVLSRALREEAHILKDKLPEFEVFEGEYIPLNRRLYLPKSR